MDQPNPDPRTIVTRPTFNDNDFEGHRAHTMYVGFHFPETCRRRKRPKKNQRKPEIKDTDTRPVTPPAERVQFIIGEDDTINPTHPLFTELIELIVDENEWRETARWIKFEEDVEEGGNRWSKPHVATVSLHSLFELRSCLLNGTVMLDIEASNLSQIADFVLENMINSSQLKAELRDRIKETLLLRHRHQHEKKEKFEKNRLPLIRSLADIGRISSKISSPNSQNENLNTMNLSPSFNSLAIQTNLAAGSRSLNSSTGDIEKNLSSNDLHRANQAFMRKVAPNSEAGNILVGEIRGLDCQISAFVRLSSGRHLGDLTEIAIPSRFLFILLGPPEKQLTNVSSLINQSASSQSSSSQSIPSIPAPIVYTSRFHEIGRAMATLLTDEIFIHVAYKARNRLDLLAGIDEFLDAVTVLPPGVWDPASRIEPPTSIPSQESRKKAETEPMREIKLDDAHEEEKERIKSGLKRTGRLFGGLINDIKRKRPWYLSDFADAFSLQSVASIIFLYFACLAPIITFGGFLGDATGNNIATIESLVSGAVCGIIYGFFSGQPLTILGSTGPVLVYETILYQICNTLKFGFLSTRLWIGLWTSAYLILLVATDASAFVCYITRFTEENFATLISVIFIYKAIEKVIDIGVKYPIRVNHLTPNSTSCTCLLSSTVENNVTKTFNGYYSDTREMCTQLNGTLGKDCQWKYVPDVFLFSILLFIATYTFIVLLKEMKMSSFFTASVRKFFNDFAVVIVIVTFTMIDMYMGFDTPKLVVPNEFKPTRHDRGWLIPFFHEIPAWAPLVAAFPALLAVILIFMDQQITAVIVNRKENKLKKGCGYHLDLFVLSILIAICSIFGLPWFVAATVLSITHVNSLQVESETAAPGEKPQFLGVREQRLTQILIFVLCGLSIFITSILSHIPMPILYGVFLFMGTSSLKGSQFFDRILILFMPQKYQPDYIFLRHVPTMRVHLFTAIQIACFALLWTIKSFFYTSILFPLMLVFIIAVRRLLDLVFDRRELMLLDDALPNSSRRKKIDKEQDDKKSDDDDTDEPKSNEKKVSIPLSNGKILKIPVEKTADDTHTSVYDTYDDPCKINISEQLTKSTLWKSIDQQQKEKISG